MNTTGELKKPLQKTPRNRNARNRRGETVSTGNIGSDSRKKVLVRSIPAVLNEMYDCMAAYYGPTHWWPGDSEFEIAVGAVLTQNTAWTNVERAIANLKQANLLSARKILGCPDEKLHEILRPSGYFRVKTTRLRTFCEYLVTRYAGSVKRMARSPIETLKPELLAVDGIGPETADDILLYACHKPVFVVDAYTRRIFTRHGLAHPKMTYGELQRMFHVNLEPDLHRFKEYHALIVWTGKEFCRNTPKCDRCPLAPTLRGGQPPNPVALPLQT